MISPSAICCLISSTLSTSACGTSGLTLPSPTPSSLSPKVALPPPFQVAVLDRLDRQEDGRVDALLRAREDVRAEERLVGVDADPPALALTGRVERAEAAAAGDLEDHVRAARDLVQRQLLALRLVVPVLRVVVDQLDPGSRLLGAGEVAGDEAVDGRLLHPADGADHVLARPGASPRAPPDSRRGTRPPARGRAAPGRWPACPGTNAWSTSMIANFVSGYFCATLPIASPCAKPTPITRS